MDFFRRLWAAITTFSFCKFYSFVKKFPTQDVTLNGKRYQILKQLGEGGYAFVYVCQDNATKHRFALKRLHCGSGDQLHAAQNEIHIMQKLNHPNLIRLLDYLVAENTPSSPTAFSDDGYGAAHVVWMLFPIYEDGSLLDEVCRLHSMGQPMLTRHILDILMQLCQGLQHMHQQGLAHRDIKPHNILIERPAASSNGSRARQQALLLEADVEMGIESYRAVIVDFGSAATARRQINSRLQALAAQEDAEKNCTAPYRAPELFDVPSSCTLDERIDVWSLGCTLYHMMYGASPFQKILDQGGSLALAVMECSIPWPKFQKERYAEELHMLVTFCLTVDPGQRPYVSQVIERCQDLMKLELPEPQACSKV